ncbi:MAG: prepilin-type N-terminal cleavage/methylation domain-containing protein [Minicystis sp.]
MRSFKKFNSNRGFTLVELMIVVAIIGVLAALAIYGVRRYLASAKTSEAKNSIGAIARNAQAAFERETVDSQILGDKADSNAASHALCLSAAKSVPDGVIPAGKKYQPSTTAGQDFDGGDSLTGWKCLKFTISSPIYYQYNYNKGGAPVSGASGGPDPGATGFEAAAKGDLNADGKPSIFARSGKVENGQLKLATQVYVFDEFE